MPASLVAYTTYDGHSAEVAERIAAVLQQAGCAVELCDVARSRSKRSLEDYDGVIGGGPLHGGKHHPQLVNFAMQYCDELNKQTSAFFSVSLSAAGNEEQQGDAVRCLNEFLSETGWKPNTTAIIAGALLYRKYGFFKRWIMKTIIRRGGTGDTDTSRNYVYTNWDAVEEFANDFMTLVESGAQKPNSEGRPANDVSIKDQPPIQFPD